MSVLFKIALRNLWRHKRRSIITGAAISLGLGMLMFSSGGTDGMTNNMVEKGTGSAAGHVVIQGPGWQESRDMEIVVPDSPAVAAKLADTLPEATIVQRVWFEGLLTSPSGAMGAGLTGVQPGPESLVNDIDDKIVEGAYLEGPGEGIVLGRTLAESLDVGIGDKVVLMSQNGGEIQNRLFRVRGIFAIGIEEIDGFYAQIPLGAAQEMLGLGTGVNQVSAHLPSARDTERATLAAREAFAGQDLDVLAWQEALPELAEYVASEQGEIYVMYSIIFVMVALGILNTVLMSVFERMREFGVMLSVGTSPSRLARLVLIEASLLGVFAVAAGIGIGLLANWPLATHGLDMSALTGGTVEVAGFALDMVIYSDLDPVKVVWYAIAVWLMTLLSAVYPAYKAATLKPIECLQHR
ncbi:MAG: ABC transporter permease [Deltaproteobacteria bacterium]|nr:ABC transporter permease [Deltaproteobacteria bacterium]